MVDVFRCTALFQNESANKRVIVDLYNLFQRQKSNVIDKSSKNVREDHIIGLKVVSEKEELPKYDKLFILTGNGNRFNVPGTRLTVHSDNFFAGFLKCEANRDVFPMGQYHLFQNEDTKKFVKIYYVPLFSRDLISVENKIGNLVAVPKSALKATKKVKNVNNNDNVVNKSSKRVTIAEETNSNKSNVSNVTANFAPSASSTPHGGAIPKKGSAEKPELSAEQKAANKAKKDKKKADKEAKKLASQATNENVNAGCASNFSTFNKVHETETVSTQELVDVLDREEKSTSKVDKQKSSFSKTEDNDNVDDVKIVDTSSDDEVETMSEEEMRMRLRMFKKKEKQVASQSSLFDDSWAAKVDKENQLDF